MFHDRGQTLGQVLKEVVGFLSLEVFKTSGHVSEPFGQVSPALNLQEGVGLDGFWRSFPT